MESVVRYEDAGVADKREMWLDCLRAIACALVVLLHTAASYLYKMQDISLYSWQVGNYIDSFTRISVPLFFMISGYLFFTDNKPKLKHYKRIIISLIFYSAIALLYLKLYLDYSVFVLIKSILIKPVFYHLWFFYDIFVVYVFASFISVRHVDKKHAVILFVVCFILLNPRLSHIFDVFGASFVSRFRIDGDIIYYLLYALFGALLGRKNFGSTFAVSISTALLYCISSVLTAYFTYNVSLVGDKFDGIFYGFDEVFVAIGACSTFVFVKANASRFHLIKRPIDLIAKNSLAIYGVHALIIDIFKREQYRNYDNPILDIGFVFLFTLLLSLVIAIIIKFFDRYRLVT